MKCLYSVLVENRKGILVLYHIMADIRAKETIRKLPAQLIHHAVQVGNLTSLKLLLGNYPHLVNERNSNYDTPLLAALKASLNKRVELSVIKFLLNCNANINLQDKDNRTVLMVACISNKTRIARLILQGMSPDTDLSVRDSDGCTALMHSVIYNDIGLIKEILSRCKTEGILIDMLLDGGYLPKQSNLKPQKKGHKSSKLLMHQLMDIKSMELGHAYHTTYIATTPRVNDTFRSSSSSLSCLTPSLPSSISIIDIAVESPEDQSFGSVLNKSTTNLSLARFVSCKKSSKLLGKSLISEKIRRKSALST